MVFSFCNMVMLLPKEMTDPSLSQVDTITAFDGASSDLQGDHLVSKVGVVPDTNSSGEAEVPVGHEVGCRAKVQFGQPLPEESTFWNNRFRRR
jgi:hypothetical protein